MKSQHLKVFFVWFAHTPLSTSLMDGKISSSRLSANMIWEYKHNVDPELGQSFPISYIINPKMWTINSTALHQQDTFLV